MNSPAQHSEQSVRAAFKDALNTCEQFEGFFINKFPTLPPLLQGVVKSELDACEKTTVVNLLGDVMERGSSTLASIVLPLLHPKHKKQMLRSADVMLQTALIGEHHYTSWSKALELYCPLVVQKCLKNALRNFDAQARMDEKMKDMNVSLLSTFSIGAIQESVLTTYKESLTWEHIQTYMDICHKYDRPYAPRLQDVCEQKQLKDKLNECTSNQHSSPSPVKLLKI